MRSGARGPAGFKAGRRRDVAPGSMSAEQADRVIELLHDLIDRLNKINNSGE